jgi:predicted nuclease with TOPRIM domain
MATKAEMLTELEMLRAENEKLKKQVKSLKTKNKTLQEFYDNAPGGGKYTGDNFGNDFSW